MKLKLPDLTASGIRGFDVAVNFRTFGITLYPCFDPWLVKNCRHWLVTGSYLRSIAQIRLIICLRGY